MQEEIVISGIDKAALLAALYNASQQQGMGFCHKRGASDMTPEEAQRELDDRLAYFKEVAKKNGRTVDDVQAIEAGAYSFDYLHGRVMKVNIGGNLMGPWGYDRDVGQGAAQAVVDALRG